jgi:hypothetical protein
MLQLNGLDNGKDLIIETSRGTHLVIVTAFLLLLPAFFFHNLLNSHGAHYFGQCRLEQGKRAQEVYHISQRFEAAKTSKSNNAASFIKSLF